MPFSSLGLSPQLLRALSERGYLVPTPVQIQVVPAALRGADIWAQAQTGSGKTAAFALPILQRLQDSETAKIRSKPALVLVPTRELAAQVAEAFRNYGRYLPRHARIVSAFGGVSINPQLIALSRGADIVVATPGRLLDLVAHNALDLSEVGCLVLDEADRLFDLGFSDELGRILAQLPQLRQNLLFSATFPQEVHTLAEQLLSEPVRIEISVETALPPDILERAIEVDAPQRTQLLRHLIQDQAWTRVLVFVSTKYATEHVAEKLQRAGIKAGALHGEMSQGARAQALLDFKAGRLQVLVTTDLASRGIDIPELPVVVNYDLPRSAVDYPHRIGRTGRAGKSGVAMNFISAETHAHFRLIEKRNGRTIPREQIEGFEALGTDFSILPSDGGIKGKRKSKKDKLREAAAEALNPTAEAPAPLDRSVRWHRMPGAGRSR